MQINLVRMLVLTGLLVAGTFVTIDASGLLLHPPQFPFISFSEWMLAMVLLCSAFFIWRRRSVPAAKCLAALPAFLFWIVLISVIPVGELFEWARGLESDFLAVNASLLMIYLLGILPIVLSAGVYEKLWKSFAAFFKNRTGCDSPASA